MHKIATKCNKIVDKWCKNKHGVSKIIDTLETYQGSALRPKLGAPSFDLRSGASPFDLCSGAPPFNLRSGAPPFNLCLGALPFDLCSGALPFDLCLGALPFDLCSGAPSFDLRSGAPSFDLRSGAPPFDHAIQQRPNKTIRHLQRTMHRQTSQKRIQETNTYLHIRPS
jgi:hypothetical protein